MHDTVPPVAATNGSDDEALLYGIDRVSKVLDCSERYVWLLIERDELEAVRLGNRTKVPADCVRDFVAKLRVEARQVRERATAGV